MAAIDNYPITTMLQQIIYTSMAIYSDSFWSDFYFQKFLDWIVLVPIHKIK